MTAAETCTACSGEPGYQGRYCAPLRCYCGHRACPAYARGWEGPRETPAEALSDDLLPSGAELSPEALRLVQRALGNAGKAPQHIDHVRRLRNRKDAETVMPKEGTVMHDVLLALADAYKRGHKGATHAELQRHLELQRATEQSTIARLCASGLVVDSGHTRVSGGTAQTVWQPTGWPLHMLGIEQLEA